MKTYKLKTPDGKVLFYVIECDKNINIGLSRQIKIWCFKNSVAVDGTGLKFFFKNEAERTLFLLRWSREILE